MPKKNNPSSPILILAPMAGFTDKAFRQICQELGADFTWSEMVSSEGLVRDSLSSNQSLALAKKFSSQEKNYWVQIFGTRPETMSQAAFLIEKKIHPYGIDINLGCPVPKAKRAGYGAVQIKNIPQVLSIIQSVKQKISLPLSLKTRVGLSRPSEILTWAPLLEKAGLDQLVVHARTLKGMFTETPHWETVKILREKLSIPVIYNGGIDSPQRAYFYFKQTRISSLMIGQAALGNPWIFSEIKKYFARNARFSHTLPYQQPDFKKIILRHAQLFQKYYPEKSLIPFRSHFSFYLKGMPQAKHLRQQAVHIKTSEDVKNILKQIN